ncbi:ABC transporter substrate-binding protein [Pseudoxanthobacter sp.]|uniref:ABC transporter substrate-binding protein n=1 Tax=Pseudoxanthobacter sp. TaxID=1925742 RepID=UPI002FE29410
MKTRSYSRRLFLTVALAAASLLPAGLGTASAGTEVLKKNDAIYNALPENIRKAGVINAATEADYPPFEFLDEQNKLIGADIDLAAALSEILGVELRNNKTEFSNIVPGVQAGRYDVGMSSIGDYFSRQKVVDFIDYYQGGTSFLVRKGTIDPKSAEDICGLSVGVLKGTSSESQAEGSSKTCEKMGKAPLKIHAFPTQNAAVLALTSKRIDAVSGDAATNGYSAKQVGDALVNTGFAVYSDRPYYGLALPKNSPLYEPLFQAMAELMKSGVYEEILDKWGVRDGALKAPEKNHGSSDE